jgi:hypothetical protein
MFRSPAVFESPPHRSHHAPGVSATLSFLYRSSKAAHSFPFTTTNDYTRIPTGNESARIEINRRREMIQQQEIGLAQIRIRVKFCVCRLGLQSNYVPPNPHSSRPRFRSEKPRRDLQKLVIFVKGLKAEPLARRLNITLGC